MNLHDVTSLMCCSETVQPLTAEQREHTGGLSDGVNHSVCARPQLTLMLLWCFLQNICVKLIRLHVNTHTQEAGYKRQRCSKLTATSAPHTNSCDIISDVRAVCKELIKD